MRRAFRASTATTTVFETEARSLGAPPPTGADAAASPADRAGSLVRHLAGELFEGAPRLRPRAAARLVELLGMEASSLLASALEEEEDSDVAAALCEALGDTRDPDALDAVLASVAHGAAKVRAAAWEAALRLAPSDVRDELIERGLADRAPSVRRRVLLAVASLPGIDPGPWAARCLDDADPQVRRVACVALGGTQDEIAARRLIRKLADEDQQVRLAARTSAARHFGDRLEKLAPAARRRAEEQAEVVAPAATEARGSKYTPAPTAEAREPEPRAPAASAASAEQVAATSEPTTQAVPEARAEATAASEPEPKPEPVPIPFAELERPLLAAIRGLTPGELAAQLGRDADEVESALEAYLEEGRVVRRGRKIFLP